MSRFFWSLLLNSKLDSLIQFGDHAADPIFEKKGSAAWKCWLHRSKSYLRLNIAKSKELLKSNFFELVMCMSFNNLVWFVFNHVNLLVAFLSLIWIYNVTLEFESKIFGYLSSSTFVKFSCLFLRPNIEESTL